MCFGVIQRFGRRKHIENGLLRKGQAVNLFLRGAFFVRSHPLPYVCTARRVRADNLSENLTGQGFIASYKHLRLLYSSLRTTGHILDRPKAPEYI